MKSLLTTIIIIISFSMAQEKATGPGDTATVGEPKPATPPKNKTMEEALKDKNEIQGLFTLYQDTTNGKLSMLIKKEQLEKEFIHFVHGLNGQLNAGVFKGNYRGTRVLKLNRYFNRIEFEVQNNAFWFEPETPLSKSADANISTAILASAVIVAEKDGAVLIEIDNIFLSEALHQISRGLIPGGKNKNPFKIGKLAKDRSKYSAIKNYPENTDIAVQYVYANPMPTNWGSDKGLTDPRSVNVTIQHSFIQMPENDYTTRYEDVRVGYFATQITDMTTPDDVTPYRDLIHRWHLEKKHPQQEYSEPVNPIVWWIENTTPHEFRGAITEGVLAWNKAFEKAGFRNAVEVKIQPDDAAWDAGDIRYNVLRWTSSPRPPFGGYGPSFVNPRTGQILGADIMLEYVYFTNRVKYEQLYKTFDLDSDSEIDPTKTCLAGDYLHQGNLFGLTALTAIDDFSQLEQHRMIYESLVKLTLHEVGHTLGLNHNFYASHLHSFKNIHDRLITEPVGLTSSVMDYVTANVSDSPSHHGQFYSTTPGPYDIWAIEFGYTPSLESPVDEEERMEILLSQSTKNELGFGNDADDMRSPGKGIDPRVNVSDMSNDPVAYAQQRMDIIRSLFPNLKTRYEKKGESYHAFRDAFSILNREYTNSANVISRYVGGVYVDRSLVGQEDRNKPFVPVPEAKQKWAMTLLGKYVFAPNAYEIPDEVFNYLQSERRGFSGTKDPKIHDMILGAQKGILDHLLHMNVLKRISDSELYGNSYNLNDMMGDLTTSCFSADAGDNVNGIRRNLQIEYTERLIRIVQNKGKVKYDYLSVSAAFHNLNKVKKYTIRSSGVNATTRAHRQYLTYRIDKTLAIN
ncbi:MAG: DUF5117 domain-containing protein [Candidatus Marinimicrobia bacterium]|nr:DUF5117 domain-containing protein [Candidatus Neomarinimicrobiota bacterium]